MSDREIKIPGPDHPFHMERTESRVIVRFASQVVANTRAPLIVIEARYPEVIYIPTKDVEHSYLRPSDHKSYCPYKGDATYYHLLVDGKESRNAVWAYENPNPSLVALKDHMAFYLDRVDQIDEILFPTD